jgi:hypothetical protein
MEALELALVDAVASTGSHWAAESLRYRCLPVHLVPGEGEDGRVEYRSLYQVQLWPFNMKETAF